MTKVLLVVGLQGAGKTTLLTSKEVMRRYKVLNMGDIMLETAISKKYVKNRDQIRYLSPQRNMEMQREAAKKIPKMSGNVILDTHATVEARGRFMPGITFETMKIMKETVGVVFIDATNEEIQARRRKDKKREREVESSLFLNRLRIISLATLSYYSTCLNIPLYVIDNTEGKLKQSVKAFLSYSADAFGEK